MGEISIFGKGETHVYSYLVRMKPTFTRTMYELKKKILSNFQNPPTSGILELTRKMLSLERS